MDGVLAAQRQFTLAALKRSWARARAFRWCILRALCGGDGEARSRTDAGGDSEGDAQGYQLTLSKIEDSSISFHGTHLLTLSACSTAKGDAAKDGLEMDSLGMIAQEKDAEAVLASLWDVSDASTSQFDERLLRAVGEGPGGWQGGGAAAGAAGAVAWRRGGGAEQDGAGIRGCDESGQEQGARRRGSVIRLLGAVCADWEFSVASGAWCAATVIICWSSFEREKSVCNEDG